VDATATPSSQAVEPFPDGHVGAFSSSVEGPGLITEKDDKRAFEYTQTTRFGIYLDETTHPFDDLDYSDCDFFGYVSNWSVNGPFSYPIGFEIVKEGSCVVRNGKFQVHILGLPQR
jgi:hypothetical protein